MLAWIEIIWTIKPSLLSPTTVSSFRLHIPGDSVGVPVGVLLGVPLGVQLGAGEVVGATVASHFPKVHINSTQH